MAEKKNPVKAPTFKQTVKNNYEMERKNDKKYARIIPRELKFSDLTPNPTPKLISLTESSGRLIRPSRMLIYEDSSDEDEASRSTPPNMQERKMGTPGAPTKSRKDFEKKVLRPKKLVYNDKGNDNHPEDLQDKENQFYQKTPKKSEKKVDDGDFYYEKFLDITAIIPRKIIPIREDDSLSVYSTNRQLSSEASTSSRSVTRDRNKSRNEGSRKKTGVNGSRKSSRSRVPKNDPNCNKENTVVQFATERDIETGESSFESSKNRSVKNDRNREEFMGLFKTGDLTHFRI